MSVILFLGVLAAASDAELMASEPLVLDLQEVQPAAEEAPPDERFLMWGFRWGGKVTAGLTIIAGNTKSTTAAVDTDILGQRPKDEFRLRAGYVAGRQEDPGTGEDITTSRKLFGWSQYKRFLTEKAFVYALAQAEKDGVRQLDLLYNVGVGGGYQWIRRDTMNLSTEAGIGFTDENYEDDTADTDYLSARAALHYDQKLTQYTEFFHDSEWLPSLDDFDEDQIVHTVTGIRTQLRDNLSAEAKVFFHWDSSPATGQGRRDATYVLGLTWTF